MIKLTKKQTGFSLVELMVSLAAGMIVVGGVVTVYISTISSSSESLKMSKLNQEMTAMMSVMSNDIRRAGIWGGTRSASSYLNPQSNEFAAKDKTALEVIDDMSSNTEIPIEDMVDGTDVDGGECIVYAYDSDDNGALDNNDIVGFRYNSTDKTVEMRQNGDTTANTVHDSCNDADDSWLAMNDKNTIEVTNLKFNLKDSVCINTDEPNGNDDDGDVGTDDTAEMDCYTITPNAGDVTTETREVDITLEAQLASDTSIKFTLEQTVRVRNDLVWQN